MGKLLFIGGRVAAADGAEAVEASCGLFERGFTAPDLAVRA